MPPELVNTIDVHVHVGRLGKEQPELGQMSDWYRRQIVFKVFLLYAGIKEADLSDTKMRDLIIQTIAKSSIGKVVCLALDPVFDQSGRARPEQSHLWVSNEYVLQLRRDLPSRILFGASVHPYDPQFRERVRKYVDQGAVLLKWLPSAQQINLADNRVREALTFLATARGGKPLPVLLHIGPEYAIPTSDKKTTTYDFLSWSVKDKVANLFRFAGKWHEPEIASIRANLHAGLDAGTAIIFAHLGLPYYASGAIGSWFEHGDFAAISSYLWESHDRKFAGRCFADVSAICTPTRRRFFADIAKLPPETLLYGSDFPCPVFELSADHAKKEADFRAMLHGHLERFFIPEDNLLNVNYRELRHFFPGHAMFTNFQTQLLG